MSKPLFCDFEVLVGLIMGSLFEFFGSALGAFSLDCLPDRFWTMCDSVLHSSAGQRWCHADVIFNYFKFLLFALVLSASVPGGALVISPFACL